MPELATTGNRASWMAPGTKREDLLYISNEGSGDVDVYSYPKLTPVGVLSGLYTPKGECADSAGNVFITTGGGSQIVEYGHGGSEPIATLADPYQTVEGCSVDPTTGNLAAANFSGPSISQGSISIYKHATGSPEMYFDLSIYYVSFCGYDDRGDLFVDGVSPSRQFVFAELPKGSSLFKNIFLRHPVYTAGNIQWDGKFVAVGDQGNSDHGSAIYQDKGASGNVIHTTPLDGSCDVVQFWIQGHTVIGPDSCNNDVALWKYPRGGSATATLTGFSTPYGATVSGGRK